MVQQGMIDMASSKARLIGEGYEDEDSGFSNDCLILILYVMVLIDSS